MYFLYLFSLKYFKDLSGRMRIKLKMVTFMKKGREQVGVVAKEDCGG
jgi:hypothetical protein